MNKTVERYAYKNTTSMAGRPEKYEIKSDDIDLNKTWTNYYGNPCYVFHMKNGDTFYMVDEYGALNDLGLIRVNYVKRKKDMFVPY